MLIDSQIVKVPNIVNINALYIKIGDLYRETLQLVWPQAPGRLLCLISSSQDSRRRKWPAHATYLDICTVSSSCSTTLGIHVLMLNMYWQCGDWWDGAGGVGTLWTSPRAGTSHHYSAIIGHWPPNTTDIWNKETEGLGFVKQIVTNSLEVLV